MGSPNDVGAAVRISEMGDSMRRLGDDISLGALGLTADKKTRTSAKGKPGAVTAKRSTRGSDQHIASALRNAYEEAVQEDVPSEFLDLLGKLS